MSLFQGDYLRVRTPETIDGVTVRMENDMVVFREDFLPLEAQRDLQRENDKLPNHLKKRIEIVRTNPLPISVPQPTKTNGKIK